MGLHSVDSLKLWFNVGMTTAFPIVALIGKYNAPEITGPVLALARFLEARGVRVLIDAITAQHIEQCPYEVLVLEDIGREANLAIVLGGDGTMLNIARTLAPFDVALVGVNRGRLGFLTDISLDTLFETISAILDGHYVTEQRMLLQSLVYSQSVGAGQAVLNVLAFNDVVVAKGFQGGLIEIEVQVDGEYIYSQRSDGLIVATPTGSTAYALSAGGPVVHPSLSVITVVPVAPHTLSNRPIVLSSASVIDIIVRRAEGPRAHFDSHSHFDLHEGDRVQVQRYPHQIKLLHPIGHSYYAMLREKLHWNRD